MLVYQRVYVLQLASVETVFSGYTAVLSPLRTSPESLGVPAPSLRSWKVSMANGSRMILKRAKVTQVNMHVYTYIIYIYILSYIYMNIQIEM